MNPRKLVIWLCAITVSSQVPATNAQDAHQANKAGGAKTSSAAADQNGAATGAPAASPGTIDAAHPHGYQHDQALIQAVRDAKLINSEYPLRLIKNKDECLVTTLLNPKATEKNLKVEAVLVAKAIMEADKTVLIVHYRMKNRMRDPDCQVIIVKKSDVKAYGASAI